MRPVVTAAEMRALDRATIDELGLPGMVLMETAGRAVAAAVLREPAGGSVVVVCGPGSMEQAHRADEYLAVEQLSGGQAFVQRLLSELV